MTRTQHGRARSISSQMNKTSIFSIMGGLAPTTTISASSHRAYSVNASGHPTNQLVIPTDPVQGLSYMCTNNLLSVNPQCSGGVGRSISSMLKCSSNAFSVSSSNVRGLRECIQ